MTRILCCWLGRTDLQAADPDHDVGLGPIAMALREGGYDEAVLLSDYGPELRDPYLRWLEQRVGVPIRLRPAPLDRGPTDFAGIHEHAVAALEQIQQDHGGQAELTFHLSPGTPAMMAVWILLAKTRFPAALIESTREHGIRRTSVPFDISAEFVPTILAATDRRLTEFAARGRPGEAHFRHIVHRSAPMQRVVARAQQAAGRDVPVLIQGETGTGKELFANAIHNASPRADAPFEVLNCGAIPEGLVESELFGHRRGAFTGAERDHKGVFERAHRGTVFLDEIGELPLQAQVKLLRALQQGEFVPLGAQSPVRVDVRIIAATNRNLIEEVRGQRFRPDLFYRLAVVVLSLPPLRERRGDLTRLIDELLREVNAEGHKTDPEYEDRRLSPRARNLLLEHPWPGNARELRNTLLRAAIWSGGPTIRADDVREAILPSIEGQEPTGILERPLGDGLDIHEVLGEVVRHYLGRALEEAHGNKTRAAELVGLPSYQTFSNWMSRYGVQPPASAEPRSRARGA
jgi:DNA-binding NtrC family response regulator